MRLFRGRGAIDEGGGGEGGKDRKPEGDILDSARACRCGDQEERGDSSGPEELRRHHAIGVARPAQDTHETDRHGEEDRPCRREEKISHRRPPG
jgi:hypothetical protein